MSRSLFRTSYRFFCDLLHSIVVFVITAVISIRAFDWRVIPRFSLAAYRRLGSMKPIYRDSHRTHGLNITPLRC
ncbi:MULTISPECIES: hypothetical protein [unclassified Ensifer]|uniref:hypothetical protein n=1 Tax=unclassified Ensifer TaxID=2633371 RepID=UPI000812F2EE|nr:MULTISPECIES: hypothetical protein [unclassified Ensifer]OCP17441.1 hypothetical protein BC361_08260 [Ensifer sp. LC54]OCP28653.1 hypothetical protein BC363_02095 [Ensifer sp. LC384]